MESRVSTSRSKAKASENAEAKQKVVLPRAIAVSQLGQLLGVSAIEVIKDLMKKGVMANINQAIDYHTAATVAANFGFEAAEQRGSAKGSAVKAIPRVPGHLEDDRGLQKPRPPIITIMGHVDHGKTTLLDAIRKSNIVATEAGEITQHIGAYQVEVKGQKITFLDTPGHEAFTAMRARGAQVTDITVLVVAADDGVMPQTMEAIDHAKAAEVPIVVVINKIDKPNSNPERVKQQLGDYGLLIEEWGGDVICVPVSAKKKKGISDLLENLLVVAEVSELKANPQGRASGVVIEAQLNLTKGALATILVQRGTLKVGDSLVAGEILGKVKAMFDDRGEQVKRAEPGTPVEVLGLNSTPQAGDTFAVVTSEKEGRALIQKRQRESEKETALHTKAPLLDTFYDQIRKGRVKELNIILKTDVQGSIEPLRNSLERLSTEEVKVRIIHSGSGSVAEGDVMLAIASRGIIVGFNTRPEPGARKLADAEGIDVRFYDVIYALVNDIEKALVGMLEPVYEELVEGHAEVRAVFNVGKAKVAGVYVTDGRVTRSALAKVLRKGELVHSSVVNSLKHFKDDVTEMSTGFECGVGIEGLAAFQVGDIIEFYRKERTTRR